MRNQTNKIQKRYFVFSQYFSKIKNKIGYDLLAFALYCYNHSWYTIRAKTKTYGTNFKFYSRIKGR